MRRALVDEKAEAADHLAVLAARWRRPGRPPITTQLVDMEAIPDAIASATGPGTLVCMASHGRGRSEALLGSVAEVVLRTLGRPVLVVGPHVPAGAGLGGGRLVACLDGSGIGAVALPTARAWAQGLRMPLWLVQVAPAAQRVDDLTGGDVVDGGALARVARELGGVAGWDVLHGDDVSRALADVAGYWSVDVLVMATHGRSGWDRLRLGSTTAATIHRSPAPVLVVPASG